jgi:hypothetical protein
VARATVVAAGATAVVVRVVVGDGAVEGGPVVAAAVPAAPAAAPAAAAAAAAVEVAAVEVAAAMRAPPQSVRTGGTDRNAPGRSPTWPRAALACACVGAAVLVWRGLRAR